MPSDQEKPKFVQENFNKIAKQYDLFNDLNSFYLHRNWKNMIRKIIQKNKPDCTVCLDLCCGTGDIALRLTQLPNLQKLYALDFSENMLQVAKDRLHSFSFATVEIGDATDLKNIQNSYFDAVTVGFGLRNVGNLEKSLQEIHRVLKPGGIFINLDVGKVKIPFVRFFADLWFFHIVPKIGYLLWGGKNDMFDYLPVSSLSYPEQSELKNILEQNQFQNVSYRNFAFGNVALHVAYKI